jgi:hypothetical protein
MSCREYWAGETPQALAPRRLPNRPRKASAWSGNQQTSLTELFLKIHKYSISMFHIFLRGVDFPTQEEKNDID